MNEILITGLVSVTSVAVGFFGSYFLLSKQITESKKERVRDRKITAAKDAIDSACELLGAVSDLSDINKTIIIATQNKANLATIMERYDLFSEIKTGQQEIREETKRYRNIMAHISFPEKLGNEYVEFTNYLNSLIFEDIREKWPGMLAKANSIIDKIKKEIEFF